MNLENLLGIAKATTYIWWTQMAHALVQGLDAREAFLLSTCFWLARLGSKQES